MLRAFFNFFVFSSIFIALCAILMVWQTNAILGLRYDCHSYDDYLNYYSFVFFSTICSYNFHWYLTPSDYSTSERLMWGARHKVLQLALCGIGALGAAWFAWQLKRHWLPLSGGVALTFLYSAPKLPQKAFVWLRKIAIGKTVFLTFVWMYVTTLLPALISCSPLSAHLIYFCLHRFFLIYAICILFDYRDVESDRQQGIRSLITFLPADQLFHIYYFSLALAAVCALLLWPLAGTAVTATLLAPVMITGLLTRNARSNRSDYMYYFILDGLMMLSALLHLVLACAL